MRTFHSYRLYSIAGLLVGVMACHDLSPKLPAGIVDPDVYTTPVAARQQARYARYVFQLMLPEFIEATGLFTDELISGYFGTRTGDFSGTVPLDSRNVTGALNPVGGIPLRKLGEVRRYTQQARNALAKYAPDDPPALRGEIYTLEGLTVIYMADLFCSGVPLSTVDFEEDFTYTRQLTTQQLYEHAITLFDTAITLGQDSARVHFFARTGKARALIALGRYQDADTVVASLPDDFRYQLPLSSNRTWASLFRTDRSQIASGEGGNGLPFRNINPNEQDARIKVVETLFAPPLFEGPGYYPEPRAWWTVASSVEARMIRAEAAVHRGDATWLSFLNGARTDSTFQVVIEGDEVQDTVWNAGTGGVEGLAPLRDPALDPLPPGKTAEDVRIDLVFRERGFWLFLTGTRQGDLRRLVREYERSQETVYPSGVYMGGSGVYGRDVNLEIGQDEVYNPHYSRCMGRGA